MTRGVPRIISVAGLAASAALVLASMTGCSALGLGCSAFALSLAKVTGGAATPQLAVARFVRVHNGVTPHLPTAGWRLDERAKLDGSQQPFVVMSSGSSTLHVIKGSDDTWQVDSGRSCSKS